MTRKYEFRLRADRAEDLRLVTLETVDRLFDNLPPRTQVDVETLQVEVTPGGFGTYMVCARAQATSAVICCRVHQCRLSRWHGPTCRWRCPVEGCKAFVNAEDAGWPDEEGEDV